MAQVPSEDDVKEAQFDTAISIEEKRIDQERQGKGFEIDPDGHGPGVVPEDVWKERHDG